MRVVNIILYYTMSNEGAVQVQWIKRGGEDEVRLLHEGSELDSTKSGPLQGSSAEQFVTSSDGEGDTKVHSLTKNGICAGKKSKTPSIIYVIAFFSIIGGFLFGYDTGVIAGALLELDKDYRLETTKKELLVSITVAAAAVGAVCGGPLNEKVGRKKTIMIASVVFAVGAVVMVGAPPMSWGWGVVFAGRSIVGVGIGMASMTVPMYLAECAPVHMRGRLTVADNMAITGGQFAAGIIDYSFSYVDQGWRFMLGVAAVPAVVRFIAFFFLPESPRWLMGRGRREAAREVLSRLRRGEPAEEVERELQEIRRDLEENAEKTRQSIFRKLWTIVTTRHLLLALVVGCGLQAIQQLSGINTLMYYSPTILRMAGVVDDHTAIGLGAIIAFGNFIFTLLGIYLVERSGRRKLILSSLAGVIFSLIVLGFAFYLSNTSSPLAFAPAASDSINSSTGDQCRPYSRSCSVWRNCDDCVISDDCHYCVYNGSYGSWEAVGLCVSTDHSELYYRSKCAVPDEWLNYNVHIHSYNQCSSLNLYNTTVHTYEYCPNKYAWLTMGALVMYIVAFSPGMGPVPWTVNAEIYPNWARSVGVSVATTTNWVSNLLVSITFLHLTRYLTRYGAFWLYTAIASGGWLFIFFLLPETRGKPLEQAEDLFRGKLCPPPGISRVDGTWCKSAYRRLGPGSRPYVKTLTHSRECEIET